MPRGKKYSGGARPKYRGNRSTNAYESSEDSDSESAETKFCTNINGSIQRYESVMKDFRRIYLKWSKERQITLEKLKELVKDVHNDQLAFNQNSLLFKKANITSREMKDGNDNSNVDFFASLAAFITDAADGVNSIVQACNVDNYMKTFGEIMENDAEITKPMHSIRSKCFAQYEDIEEIIRRYHSETFGSTLSKISQSLKTEDLWLDVKNSNNGDGISQVCQAVDSFLQRASRVEVFNEIGHSVGSYLDSNPAVLEACESTGKALYGIYDTWGRDTKQKKALTSSISSGVNQAIMLRGQREIMRLQSLTMDEETSQAKLESKIHEAIEELEQETREMKLLYDSSRQPSTFGSNSPSNHYNSMWS